jgi:hypothetical protein
VVALTPEELNARRAHIDRVGRRVSTGLILLGVALVAVWILTGFVWGWIPGAVAAAAIGPSLIFVAVGIGIRVGVARSQRRRGSLPEEATSPSRADLASRFRWLAIGNTVAAVIVVPVAWILFPGLWAIVLTAVMIIGAADTWYLYRKHPKWPLRP